MAINLIDLLANKMISKSIQLLDLTSIESIEMDSRLVRSNTLFVAIKGVHSNEIGRAHV